MKDLNETKVDISYSAIMKCRIDYWEKRYDPHNRFAIIQQLPENETRKSINKRYIGERIKVLMMNFF